MDEPQSPINSQPTSSQSSSKRPLIIGGLILVLVVAAGSYYLGKQSVKISKEDVFNSNKEILTPSPVSGSFVKNVIIVKFKPNISVNLSAPLNQTTNSKSINQILEKIKAEKIESVFYNETSEKNVKQDEVLKRYFKIKLNPSSKELDIINLFQSDPGVENAILDYILKVQ